MTLHPTNYPEVNEALSQLRTQVESTLADQLLGLYLYGSLATGGFDLATSDVDFVVVTKGHIPNEISERLAEMHQRLLSSGSKWIKKLEGSYISQKAFRRFDPDDETAWPTLNEEDFYLAPHGSDWIIQRHVVREHGVVLVGPLPQTLIDPVGTDALRQSVVGYLHEWWLPMSEAPARLHSSEYQTYAILSMCRAAHLLEHGSVVSKQEAAQWALETLGSKWATIITDAMAWQEGMSLAYVSETVVLILLVGERSRNYTKQRQK